MKTRIFALIVPLLLAVTIARAQTYAKDDAAGYTTLPNNSGWDVAGTTNGGFGFNPWVFRTNGLNFSGFYVGNGGAIASTNGNAWGMYANGTAGVKSAAFRSFTNALPVNSVFKIKWRNIGIGNSTDNLAGFCLRNGNSSGSVDDASPLNSRFAFYYIGGISDNFRIFDSNNGIETGLGFGSGPFELNFILLTADTYQLIVKNAAGTTVITNYTGTLAGSGSLDSLALFAYETAGDQVFNSLEISAVSVIPPQIANVSPTNNAFYATETQLSFDVLSPFSGVSPSGITLVLNGATQSNLSFSGTSSSNHVVLNTALQGNVVYTGTITAQDVNGNRATNNFTFNTWRSSNPFIEAEDYNYNSGGFIAEPFPNEYGTIVSPGVNGIDFLETADAGTNYYRPQDIIDTEPATDADHADFVANGYVDYNLSFVQFGEWANYTRKLSNTTYAVYARLSAIDANATILLERHANPTATSSNQPSAALGTFVGTDATGLQNYRFIPLKDIFSNPVEIRFSGTNTFRTKRVSGAYNFNYILLVPSTNAATLRPYISAGYPFPGAGSVALDQNISFTIANRMTTVTPASIKLYVNSSNVTSGIVLSNNSAGTIVNYQSPTIFASGSVNTVRVEYADSGAISQTNQWQFTAATVATVPSGFALASGSGVNSGFNIHIAKAPNEASADQFPATATRAENHLAGLIINTNTSLPWTNEASGPNNNGLYSETNVINYNQALGFSDSGIAGDVNFPYVPQTLNGSYTNDPNYISMEAISYVQLSAGIHKWAVRCDDGFQLAFGAAGNPTNYVVATATPGSDTFPTEFEFVVQADGIYPMRLLYYEGTVFANVELYSVNRTNGQTLLINDTNSLAVKAYRSIATTTGIVLRNISRTGTTAQFTFETQTGKTHYIEYKDSLNDLTWQPLTTISGNGSVATVTDNTASVPTRYYRARTQ
jgi:hypothetical protein